MEFIKVTTDLPRVSCKVVVIREDGFVADVHYSVVHQKFNVLDSDSNERAESMQIKVTAWKYFDEFFEEVKYV